MKYKIYCSVRESFCDGKEGYINDYKRTYFSEGVFDGANTDNLTDLVVDSIINNDKLDDFKYSIKKDTNYRFNLTIEFVKSGLVKIYRLDKIDIIYDIKEGTDTI